MKILIIEDDAATAAYVANGLKQVGHRVDHAPDVRGGLVLAVGHTYDVMIVDRMLAGLDGLGIVKTIRSTGVKTPVLFLTALGGIEERVAGLEAGGDDYLVKPFAFSELLARIDALRADLIWDGSGTGNCWSGNRFATSTPPELPACH